MPLNYHFICPLPAGIHARPASLFEEVSRCFTSEILLQNQRTGFAANTKSVLAILGAEIRENDACALTVTGPDEQSAMAALARFVANTLPHCDDDAPPAAALEPPSQLPLMLRPSDATAYRGTAVVGGVGVGRVVQVGSFKIPDSLPMNGAANPAAEWRETEAALLRLTALYDRRLAAAHTTVETDMWKAHRAMARDPEFHRQLQNAILQNKRTAAGAISDTEAHFSAILSASGMALLRERALDVRDVSFHLLQQIHGNTAGLENIRLDADTILVAESLTPGQFLALDRVFLKGLVLILAGTTSHTVILARSFGIPTLTGAHELAHTRLDQQEAVLDAGAGLLLVNLTDAARRYYALEQNRLRQRQERFRQFALRPAATLDGCRLEIGANIAGAEEAAAVFAAGAEGVGLFRTEMLFLGRPSAPDESEQFETYRRVLEAAKNLPVIIRTMDIGGDKPLDYLKLPAEENPFLGYRAIRIYPEFEAMFRTQVRALIRASAHGNLKLLLPMVASVEEARWAKVIIAQEQSRCAGEGLAFDKSMPVGAMIEVPAAAFAMDALCRELDFFSIGSNDLLQYFMAADRADTRLAKLYNPLHPSFLRLLKQTADAARACGKWIGLCGEMGGQTSLLPLLAGLGLDEISVAAPAIAWIKAELAGWKYADCARLVDAALECSTPAEVAALLGGAAGRRDLPLLDPELVLLDSDAATKEEAVKLAVDRLYVTGRAENSRAVEDAVWHREQTSSTGFGHGFAIPHCKTDAVLRPSLVLLKPRAPVPWNSLDAQPVRVILLFAVRETGSTDARLKTLANLSRKLMDEDFRARLEKETDPKALCALLGEAVGGGSQMPNAKV